MKSMRFIRCKGKNDVLVVSPKVWRWLGGHPLAIGQCGHPHQIVMGPAKFIRARRKNAK